MAGAGPGLSGWHFPKPSSCHNVEVGRESPHLSGEPQCNPSLPGARRQPRAGRSKVLSIRKRERKGLRKQDHFSHPQITWRSHFP